MSSPQAVSNSVYMNVPSHLPEYVNVPMEEDGDKRHQYVNVPLESFASPSRRKHFVFLILFIYIIQSKRRPWSFKASLYCK